MFGFGGLGLELGFRRPHEKQDILL
jgi:hypothetical protein